MKKLSTRTAMTTLTLSTLLFTGCLNDKGNDSQPNTPTATVPEKTADSPTLKLDVEVSGSKATVHFITTNFKISPEHYSQAHVPGEGHIHLFVDGSPSRIGVKESTYVLKNLKPGKHTLKASLHTNNHQPYNVEDSVQFEIQ
jgi:hypothetical protein